MVIRPNFIFILSFWAYHVWKWLLKPHFIYSWDRRNVCKHLSNYLFPYLVLSSRQQPLYYFFFSSVFQLRSEKYCRKSPANIIQFTIQKREIFTGLEWKEVILLVENFPKPKFDTRSPLRNPKLAHRTIDSPSSLLMPRWVIV